MAQPFDRAADVPQPCEKIDESLGEFWTGSPWYIQNSNNLSCYERNRLFLNTGGNGFVDVSHISRTDSDGDGRSVVAADLRGSGRLDLIVRQAGGGALLVFENRMPTGHWLEVSLRGTKSNSFGIGARLEATIGDRRLVEYLFPNNSYRSQAPARVHFGLGDARQIDRLTIHWPSGEVQEFRSIKADQHLLIREGADDGGMPINATTAGL